MIPIYNFPSQSLPFSLLHSINYILPKVPMGIISPRPKANLHPQNGTGTWEVANHQGTLEWVLLLPEVTAKKSKLTNPFCQWYQVQTAALGIIHS